MRVLALSGSLRAQSLNTLLLHEAARLAPPGMEIDLWERLDDLPHYIPERDTDPLPAAVVELRSLIAETDAVLICTPEYIHAMPAVLKNLLEWTVSSGEWVAKPTAAWSVSPSLEGGAKAHVSLVHTLARSGLDEAGRLADPAQVDRLRATLEALAVAVEAP